MANSDKDILITTNKNQSSLPEIKFTGSNNTPIYLRVLDDGTVSIEGTNGQLFSVTDSMSGTIFSVNDISGVPAIEVLDTGVVKIGAYGGRVVIGSSSVLEMPIVSNPKTASYTLVRTDAGKLIEMNVASANNLTVPLNSSVPFPIGTKIDILQTGAGQTTVVATSGVTINTNSGLKLSGQWAAASLIKRASDTWVLVGSISA